MDEALSFCSSYEEKHVRENMQCLCRSTIEECHISTVPPCDTWKSQNHIRCYITTAISSYYRLKPLIIKHFWRAVSSLQIIKNPKATK